MRDFYGNEYEPLLVLQAKSLQLWSTKLQPALFAEVKNYVLSMNQPGNPHRVFRGWDIPAIAEKWPDLPPAYPKPTEDVI
jgi:hypothetical protein